MTNPHVEKWQRKLASVGTYAGMIDGMFGPQTLRASEMSMAVGQPNPEPDKHAMTAPQLAPMPANRINLKKAGRPINELIWHCAATPEGRDFTVNDIRSWHRARGWSDIGYHFVVYRDGTIHEGRPIEQIGAHVAGRNTGTIGACYIGGVARDGKTAKDTRTHEQRAAMLWLTRELAKLYQLDRISGHRQFAAKACPSFDVRTDELGNIEGYERGRRV